jgi:predicted dehydrogenase
MRIAVVGLGFMGSTHLQAWQHIPNAEIVAVVSDDPVKLGGDLSAIQGNLNRPGEKLDFSKARKYRRIEDAIRDQEVDAVDLCLPTHLHAQTAVDALQAGKHVLIEKPMALDENSRRSSAGRGGAKREGSHDRPGAPLLSGLCRRPGSAARQPARTSAVRRISPPLCGAVVGRLAQESAKSGGGVFDLLIHDVDFCIHLFGLPQSVSASGYEDLPAGIDIIHAELHYPEVGGVVVTGGWHHPKSYPFSMEFTVTFQGGTMEFERRPRPHGLRKRWGREAGGGRREGCQAELEYFLECAAKNAQPELCPPAESAQAVKLTNLLVEARKKKGETIECQI